MERRGTNFCSLAERAQGILPGKPGETEVFPTLALYAAAVETGLVSGLVPFVINLEVCLLGVAALTDATAPFFVTLAAAGQTTAKSVLCQAGKGVLGVSLAAGAMRLPLLAFIVIVAAGRVARFTVVDLAPGWLHPKAQGRGGAAARL